MQNKLFLQGEGRVEKKNMQSVPGWGSVLESTTYHMLGKSSPAARDGDLFWR